MRPLCTKAMLSQIFSRSLTMWEEIRMEWFSSRVKSFRMSSISSRAMGSRPPVASSRISSLAPWDSATAMASFMRMPRE